MDEVEGKLNDSKALPKILAILTEQMQNIMSYAKGSIEESENTYKSEGHVWIGFDGTKQKYYVVTQNKMDIEDATPLREKLDKVNGLNEKELKTYYKELRRTGSKTHMRGAGLGFLEMAKRSSESLEYNIKQIDEDYMFEIKVYI